MKAIHYDTDGDILSVTFADATVNKHTGIELTDNIILYFNPDTEEPLRLILLSYQAMLKASAKAPILLDGLQELPAKVQSVIIGLLQRAPLTAFLQLDDASGKTRLAGRLHEVFTPSTLQMVATT